MTITLRHGALALLPGAAPLVERRAAFADENLPHITREHAARWLLTNGTPNDRAAAQRFLARGVAA